MSDRIDELYFDWLVGQVDNNFHELEDDFSLLMKFLWNASFRVIIDMDSNRSVDGRKLREKFIYKEGYYDDDLNDLEAYTRDTRVLEMMVALTRRMNDDILWEEDGFDKKSIIFWDMIISLGLETQNNDDFDPVYCSCTVNDWLDRRFKRNGQGSLFDLGEYSSKYGDQRKTEIWGQMNNYINKYYFEV